MKKCAISNLIHKVNLTFFPVFSTERKWRLNGNLPTSSTYGQQITSSKLIYFILLLGYFLKWYGYFYPLFYTTSCSFTFKLSQIYC